MNANDSMTIGAADAVAKVAAAPSTDQLVALCERQRTELPRVTHLHMPFGDGIYRFALGRKQVTELENLCGYKGRDGEMKPLGIGAIYGRMARGRAFLPTGEADWSGLHAAEALASEIVERDCLEVIRLALIGGGAALVDGERKQVSPSRAMALLDLYVVGQPLEQAWTYAFAILAARITGVAPNDFPTAAEPAEEAQAEALA